MRIDIPAIPTPANQAGLEHIATRLELNKKLDFSPDGMIFGEVQSDLEKSAFIVPYKFKKNEIAFLRYKYIFKDGRDSGFGRPVMVNNGIYKKEYNIDYYPSVPATPKLTIDKYNFSNNIPLEDITINSDKLTFYIGKGEHISSTWKLLDINDNVIWKVEDDKFNLDSIIIGKDDIKKFGVYKIVLIKNISANNQNYSTLAGEKIININNNSMLTYADETLKIDFDHFTLFANGESVLEFKHGIMNFQYLSIKIYDKNGILVQDEIKAKTSPVFINTNNIELGAIYDVQFTAFYLDGRDEIKNTALIEEDFIAEKYSIVNIIETPDYGNFSQLGFIPLNKINTEDIQKFNFSENFNNGESPIFIKEDMIYLGHWLNNGYVLSNKYINILNLDINKDYRVQMIQKPNGNYLIIGRSKLNPNNIKVVEFNIVSSGMNVYSSVVVNSVEAEYTWSNIILENLNLARSLYSNFNSDNILHSFVAKSDDLWGSAVPCSYYKELKADTLVSRKAFSSNGYIATCKYDSDTILSVEMSKNNLINSFSLDVNVIDITLSSAISKTNLLNLNTLNNLDNEVILDIKVNLINKDLHTNGVMMSAVMIDENNLLLFLKDLKDNSYVRYFRFNVVDKTWHKVRDNTGAGVNYKNLIISGYNIYRTNNSNSDVPLRLSK